MPFMTKMTKDCCRALGFNAAWSAHGETYLASYRKATQKPKEAAGTDSLAILRLTLFLFPWDPGPCCLRPIVSWQWRLHTWSWQGWSVLLSLSPAALQHTTLVMMDKLPCSSECQVVLTPARLHPPCSCCTLKGLLNSVLEHSPWLAPAFLSPFFVHITLA